MLTQVTKGHWDRVKTTESETTTADLSGEPLQQSSPTDTQEAALGSGTSTFLYIEQFLKIAL